MKDHQLRAYVFRDLRTGTWHAEVSDPWQGLATWMIIRPSWPEAMQAAQLMVATLDRLLMDQVHASRAARRGRRTDFYQHHLTLTEQP